MGLTNQDSLQVLEDNPTFVRFQEVLDQMIEMLPKDSSNVYLKMGLRISKEVVRDMQKMPEETIKWYCTQFGSAMLYIATGRDPREILADLGVEIPSEDLENEAS